MEFFQPATWAEALQMKAAHPEAVPIAGGTDVMVEINLDRQRPAAIMDLNRIRELAEWERYDGMLRIGAGVTYTRLIDELGDRLPGLAMASRTVGSPQIRNRGTVGGNLGTHLSSPRMRSWSWPLRRGRGTSQSTSSSPGRSAARCGRTS